MTSDPTDPDGPGHADAEPHRRPRNVLLITVDQWRGDCLSAAGHPVVQTPTLDALAGEGVRFARHYAQCAPCGPSRASLLTGMYLQNHRSVLNGTPLDARHTNVALEARALGYEPWVFGYTDTSVDPRTVAPGDPLLRTYETVLDGFASNGRVTRFDPAWVAHLARLGYDIPDHPLGLFAQVDDEPGAAGRGSTFAPSRIAAEHSETAYLTDSVLAHVRARRLAATPASPGWFVHASYLRPHPPFVAPRGYHDRYDPADVPDAVRHATREQEMAQHPFLALSLGLDVVAAPDDELERRQTAATYYGLMRQVDDELGRLFAGLRAAGEWDDTLVIVTADHGEQMGDHWMMGKLGWFESSYHIPLVVRDPRPEADATRGRVVERFTENVDVMPTVLEWLGAPATPLQCDGRSLVGFVTGDEPPEWRDAAHWEFDFRVPRQPDLLAGLGLRMADCVLNVVRTETHKYVHFPTLPPVLYDLVDDPGELVDRVHDPAQARTRLALVEHLLTWRMRNDERVLAGTQVGGRGVVATDDRLR